MVKCDLEDQTEVGVKAPSPGHWSPGSPSYPTGHSLLYFVAGSSPSSILLREGAPAYNLLVPIYVQSSDNL